MGNPSEGDAVADRTAVSDLSATVSDDEIGPMLRDHTGSADSVSRSAQRPILKSEQRVTKNEALPVNRQDVSGVLTATVAPPDPRDIAMSMLGGYGWSSDQFSCLDALWVSESDWDYTATNPSSGAYGIPQSLPGDKMATAGADWRTNPATQIEWGLTYIQASYGTPCGAWSFKQANNWY